MAETFRNKTCAYNKGIISILTGGSECPYGSTKLELRTWWNVGREDCISGNIDVNMCYEGTLKKLDINPSSLTS